MIFNKYNKIKYFAFFDKFLGIGIEKKINGFVQCAENSGWKINKKFYHKNGIFEHFKLGIDIIFCNEKNLILRSTAHSLIFIYPFIILASLYKNIILEVPTPHITSFFELIKYNRNKSFNNYLKSLLLIILGPFAFLPFKKIIQYSKEGLWWTMFVQKKIFLTTNGVDTSTIPLRNIQPKIIDSINLIGVGNISFWHGFDRVIHAINYLVNNKKISYKIKFYIIGEGLELKNLIKLTNNLNLTDNIIFIPFTETNELNQYFSNSHIAIGSLGLHRKNLYMASELKAREYTAFGIPFIASGQDLDFLGKVDFRFEIPLDDSFLTIVDLIDDIYHNKIELPQKENIRNYAINHLDMNIKINNILNL